MNVNEVFAEIVREMNCNPAKEKRPYCCCNLLWGRFMYTSPAKRRHIKLLHILPSSCALVPFILAVVSSYVACVSAWMLVGTSGGAAPSTNKNGGKNCVCLVRERKTVELRRAPCHLKKEMALHIKESLVENIHPWHRAVRFSCVHSVLFLSLSFLFICFPFFYYYSSLPRTWRASCLDLLVSDISAGEFIFPIFLLQFFLSSNNTGSDKVAFLIGNSAEKANRAWVLQSFSPFSFLSSFRGDREINRHLLFSFQSLAPPSFLLIQSG